MRLALITIGQIIKIRWYTKSLKGEIHIYTYNSLPRASILSLPELPAPPPPRPPDLSLLPLLSNSLPLPPLPLIQNQKFPIKDWNFREKSARKKNFFLLYLRLEWANAEEEGLWKPVLSIEAGKLRSREEEKGRIKRRQRTSRKLSKEVNME